MQEDDNSLEAQVKQYVIKFSKEHEDRVKKRLIEIDQELSVKLQG